MAKFKVKEIFANGKTVNTFVSCTDETTALGISTALYGGKHEVFEASTDVTVSQAKLTNVAYKDVSVMLKNNATDDKTYLNFLMKSTKTTADVKTALLNKTVNGVKADIVVITSIREVTL